MSQFTDPGEPSSGINYQELRGSLLLIKVIFLESHIKTVHTKPGETNPAIRANVAVLDGPQAGEEFNDTLIFPKVLQSQLKSRVGQLVLGRLGQGEAKPGQSAPWKLDAASAADKQTAESFLQRKSTPTISAPAQSAPAQGAFPSQPPF